MFPLFSILKREPHFQWPPAQFVLLHLKKVILCRDFANFFSSVVQDCSSTTISAASIW